MGHTCTNMKTWYTGRDKKKNDTQVFLNKSSSCLSSQGTERLCKTLHNTNSLF